MQALRKRCSVCNAAPPVCGSLSTHLPVPPSKGTEKKEETVEEEFNTTCMRLSDLGHIAADDELLAENIAKELKALNAVSSIKERELEMKNSIKKLQSEKERLELLLKRNESHLEEIIQLCSRREAAREERARVSERIQGKKLLVSQLKQIYHSKLKILELRRYQKAIQIFQVMDLRQADTAPAHRSKLSGCCTIMGIPLPNNGRFDYIPLDAVLLGIQYISHMVDALSAALSIPIPHSLQPFNLNGPLISPQFSQDTVYPLLPVTVHSLRNRIREFNWTRLKVFLSGDNEDGEHHANPTALTSSLVLLQADVIALCIHAGVDSKQLYPPQAMLLNLCLLAVQCQRSVEMLMATLDESNRGNVLDVSEVLDVSQSADQASLVDPSILLGVEDSLCRRYQPRQQMLTRQSITSKMLDDEWQWV